MSASKKILIAEDSNIVLTVVSRILEKINFEVRGVKNGEDLLKQLETNTYDLILLDINMPLMDGITCIKHIRSDSRKEIKDIPVIAITGNARNYNTEEYMSLGFSGIVEKPLDFDLLTKKIIELLD